MTLATRVLYEFGKFRLDPAEHLLLCDGKPVALTPKAFEILCVFAQNSGRLLSKDELMKRVWPNSFVEEANLSVNISALRRALGDTPDGQELIATVPKLGYRFVIPVREIREDSHARSEGSEPPPIVETAETQQSLPRPGGPVVSAPANSRVRPSRKAIRWVRTAVLLAIALGVLSYVSYRTRAKRRVVTVEPRKIMHGQSLIAEFATA